MKKTVAIIVLLSMLCFSGCGKKENQSTTIAESQAEVQAGVNFLTGEQTELYAQKAVRPVAVTVNNLEAALPQYGISDADIIMEMPVEGGITRLLAIYSDYRAVPEVCSVRSCRYYFPIFAKGFDAVYFCYGSNELLGTPMLEKTGIDYIDGNKADDELVFARDEKRLETYSPEHTVYLKGGNMVDIFEKYGFRKEISPSYESTAFQFSENEEKFLFECTEITGNFSSSYFSGFFFDKEKKVYLKNHNGEKHVDAVSTAQLEFTNVFLLETDVTNYADTNLIEIDWHGGKGYYATMGTVEEITWKKQSENSPIEFYSSAGEELKINKGKSYVGIGVQEVIMSGPEYENLS